MIPSRKKTPEEIAALREGLGIPGSPRPAPAGTAPPPAPTPVAETRATPGAPQEVSGEPGEPAIQLEVPAIPAPSPAPKNHRLRKRELPLAPATASSHRTVLPAQRHDPDDIARIRRLEAMQKLQTPGIDPAEHLRKQTAGPFLYLPGYALAFAAAVAASLRAHHITPIVLLALALAITLYIAIRKPRSRHHAALIFIVVFLTAAFGGIHYAPLFKHGP